MVTATNNQHIIPLQSDTMDVTWDNYDFEPTVNISGSHSHLVWIDVSVTTKSSLGTLSVLKDRRRQNDLRFQDITLGPAWHQTAIPGPSSRYILPRSCVRGCVEDDGGGGEC